jgi:hypothetical protein
MMPFPKYMLKERVQAMMYVEYWIRNIPMECNEETIDYLIDRYYGAYDDAKPTPTTRTKKSQKPKK